MYEFLIMQVKEHNAPYSQKAFKVNIFLFPAAYMHSSVSIYVCMSPSDPQLTPTLDIPDPFSPMYTDESSKIYRHSDRVNNYIMWRDWAVNKMSQPINNPKCCLHSKYRVHYNASSVSVCPHRQLTMTAAVLIITHPVSVPAH